MLTQRKFGEAEREYHEIYLLSPPNNAMGGIIGPCVLLSPVGGIASVSACRHFNISDWWDWKSRQPWDCNHVRHLDHSNGSLCRNLCDHRRH